MTRLEELKQIVSDADHGHFYDAKNRKRLWAEIKALEAGRKYHGKQAQIWKPR